MMNFLSIFRKKTKPVKEVVPTITLTETQYKKNDFEITEISYEEYESYYAKERRLTARQPKAK